MKTFMQFLESSGKIFYHGSMDYLPAGTILTPRNEYEKHWQNTDFYKPLEMYRPPHMLAHKDSVFMCDNIDDIDLAGGGTEYVFTVQPIGKIEKHDLNWSSEISALIGDGKHITDPEVKEAAENYWNGIPHHNESVWEYLTPKAKIIRTQEYETAEEEEEEEED